MLKLKCMKPLSLPTVSNKPVTGVKQPLANQPTNSGVQVTIRHFVELSPVTKSSALIRKVSKFYFVAKRLRITFVGVCPS